MSSLSSSFIGCSCVLVNERRKVPFQPYPRGLSTDVRHSSAKGR
jgi:hypothetical protein